MGSASNMAGGPNTRWRITGGLAPKCSVRSRTLFYNPGEKDENVGGEGDDDDENNKKASGPAEMEFSFNVGVQFGLTDVTSDTALKFQGSLSF